MTPEEFKEEMERISDNVLDIEECHAKMDDLMCGLLVELGYGEGVEIFRNEPKYYA